MVAEVLDFFWENGFFQRIVQRIRGICPRGAELAAVDLQDKEATHAGDLWARIIKISAHIVIQSPDDCKSEYAMILVRLFEGHEASGSV